jgi:hypothetical protein
VREARRLEYKVGNENDENMKEDKSIERKTRQRRRRRREEWR